MIWVDYRLHRSILTEGARPLARITARHSKGGARQILLPDGELALSFRVRRRAAGWGLPAEYVLENARGERVGCARPGYAEHTLTGILTSPCRPALVDHAAVELYQRSYLLRRERYGQYSLFDTAGALLARFNVRRFLSGWQLKTDVRFSPEILCGLVLLCKYLEWEND